MEQRTYVKSITDMQGDIQPTGSKFDPAQYGINATPANARKLFIDSGLAVSIGLVIRDKIDGAMYMVKGLSTWYSHQELILEPYEVTLP
jgi:hypothetical protein